VSTWNLYSRGDRIFGYANGILLTLFVLSVLYPFIYILAVSISSGAAVTTGRVVLFPVDVTFAAYERVLSDKLFWIAYGNTFIYTFGGTAMSLAIIIPGAYALSRERLRGRKIFNLLIAFTLWFNAGMIPFFLNMRDLGLLDSRLGIIIGFACNAFNVILLRNFFQSVPKSFEEAARMDGASEFQIYRKIIFPLLMPITISIAIIMAHISLKIFDLIYAMTGPGANFVTDVPGVYMFEATFRGNMFATGAAIAMIMLILVAIFIVPYLVVNRKGDAS
jgi:putative aldouronate transport system permease protein